MSDLSSFESVFRRALRNRFTYESLDFERILIITDMEKEESDAYADKIRSFLHATIRKDTYHLEVWNHDDYSPWPRMKERIRQHEADLLITYRMLWAQDITVNKSLGSYVDLLSQDTDFPVLVTPHPKLYSMDHILKEEGAVLVATEHVVEDDRMVNFALKFAVPQAPLILVHIEDEDTYKYYMNSIRKIPEISTEAAETTLRDQLLADPIHYAESITEVLKEKRPDITVETYIRFGHLVSAYRELLEKYTADLLVMNTKDDTQLAMHSVGYSLAVEFRQTPVLLL
ncbi:MAG: universal stress protein [Bacteroidota bacterium]